MKKIFTILFLFLIIPNLFAGTLIIDDMEYSSDGTAQAAYISNAATSEVVDQSQTSVGDAGYWQILGDGANHEYRYAQGFILSGAKTVTAAEISLLAPDGSPSGNITLRIETDNAGVPSGTLANANATVNVTPSGSAEILKGTYATPFALSASTLYWLVMQCSNQTTDVRFKPRTATNKAYSAAQEATSLDGTWTADSTYSAYFQIYVQGGAYLQSYSESTIKTQGSYALKAVAVITDSLNKTLTKTFSTNSDLTGVKNLRFDAYASRTGSQWKLGIHDTGGTTTEITPNISTANTWQPVNFDLSAVADANKDAIDTATITITNADSANTIYLDYFEIAQAIDVFGWVN